MASPSDSEPQACLLVYDGQCRLCVAAKQPHADASPIRMVPYQSEEARQALGSPIGLVVPTQHSWFARMGRCQWVRCLSGVPARLRGWAGSFGPIERSLIKHSAICCIGLWLGTGTLSLAKFL
jgi:hypothetical protein